MWTGDKELGISVEGGGQIAGRELDSGWEKLEWRENLNVFNIQGLSGMNMIIYIKGTSETR